MNVMEIDSTTTTNTTSGLKHGRENRSNNDENGDDGSPRARKIPRIEQQQHQQQHQQLEQEQEQEQNQQEPKPKQQQAEENNKESLLVATPTCTAGSRTMASPTVVIPTATTATTATTTTTTNTTRTIPNNKNNHHIPVPSGPLLLSSVGKTLTTASTVGTLAGTEGTATTTATATAATTTETETEATTTIATATTTTPDSSTTSSSSSSSLDTTTAVAVVEDTTSNNNSTMKNINHEEKKKKKTTSRLYNFSCFVCNMITLLGIVALAVYFPNIVQILSEYMRQQLQHVLPYVQVVSQLALAQFQALPLVQPLRAQSSSSPILGQQQQPLHILIPKHIQQSGIPPQEYISTMTLRQFLLDPDGFHLAMAPAFFGFYGYFGILTAWDETLTTTTTATTTTTTTTTTTMNNGTDTITQQKEEGFLQSSPHVLQSVTGSSAGAMAALLIASGIPPRKAIDFCLVNVSHVSSFADPPGFLSLFRGNQFEQLILDFLQEECLLRRRPSSSSSSSATLMSSSCTYQMEDTPIPVVVSAYDIQSFSTKLLQRGSIARAARASATFPLLFQPVAWKEEAVPIAPPRNNHTNTNTNATTTTTTSTTRDYVLMDGGIGDPHGWEGLALLLPNDRDHKKTTEQQPKKQRIVNLVIGDFHMGIPPGPSQIPQQQLSSSSNNNIELVSISMKNLPRPGPWNMLNGPKAVDASIQAMIASLDVPLYYGKEPGHYELHIDATTFISSSFSESSSQSSSS